MNDTYECYRVRDAELSLDGAGPFFLIVENEEAAKCAIRWDMRFSTYESAVEGAHALVASGKYNTVIINEERRKLRRVRNVD